MVLEEESDESNYFKLALNNNFSNYIILLPLT